MKTTYNKKDLQSHLESIKPFGFTLESFGNEFFYTKQEAQRKITIIPIYDDYFPHDIIFKGLFVDVLFNNVEQIFHDIYINNNYVDFGHNLNDTPTFSKSFIGILSEDDKNKLKSTKVYDNSSFEQVEWILYQMLNEAINFINQNQTLQDFYDLGEALNEDDQLNFYVHPASFRMAIIKKLLNLPYASFLQNEINLYNQHNMGDVASFASALKLHLDNI